MRTINSLQQLKRSRSAAFWRSVSPYLRLAGGSLPGLVVVGLTGLWMYRRWIDGLPDSFPVLSVCSIILTYGVGSVWIRTFLQPADLIYLLPLESRMSGYFRSCLRTGVALQTAKIAVFWALIWPLYHSIASMEHKSFTIMLAILIGIKWLSILFWWREIHIRTRSIRLLYFIVRLLFIFAFIAISLNAETLVAILVIGTGSIVHILLLQIPDQAIVAWEHLIHLERRRVSRWHAVLSQFAELPSDRSDVRANPLAKLARYIPVRKQSAYRYLYFFLWCRSPIFGMTLRLTIAGFLISIIADSIWLKLGLGALFAFGLRLQLLELIRDHQHHDIAFVYPIDERVRAASARLVARLIWLMGTTILFMPFAADRLW